MPAEFDFLNWIRSRQKPSDLIRLGSGDDLAILNWPANDLLLAGVDQVLDTVHFDSRRHSPRDIGRKAMNRNLSDCAAMAALPAAALATVALPAGVGIEYAKELYLGMEEAGARFNCPIIGGDTGTWKFPLAVTVTILARGAGIAPVTRGGARPGDKIYVTGPLGGSIAGRHMTFEPRVDLARQLAGNFRLTAMIDISDGLSRDLRHICRESRVGAIIEAGAIPIHADAKNDLKRALNDGEDYELLLTSPDELPGTEPSSAACGFSPSPGTPGEGRGEGSSSQSSARLSSPKSVLSPRSLLSDPHPNPLPVYQERGQDSRSARLPTALTRIGTITAEPEVLLRDGASLTRLEESGWEHKL